VTWLPPPTKKKQTQKQEQQRLPYRSYFAFTGEFIRVAKSAENGDAMLRLMPANHYWLHVLTGEGSHVWLEKPRGSKPSPRAIRDAAILAIHHSKLGRGMSGEVRFATRADVEKRKKLATGKVLVQRCETMTCKYTDVELQRILATHHERT
jgi:predicted ribosome quality control (RQC) complex YloA/Tae2 family protein